MFLGGWKIWQNFAYRTGRRLPEWTTISFMKMFSVEESLPRNLDRTYTWDDPAGANLYFMSCFLWVFVGRRAGERARTGADSAAPRPRLRLRLRGKSARHRAGCTACRW